MEQKIVSPPAKPVNTSAARSTQDLIKEATRKRRSAVGQEEYRFFGAMTTIGDQSCSKIGDSVWLVPEAAREIASTATGALILPTGMFEEIGFTASEMRLNATGAIGKTEAFRDKWLQAMDSMKTWLRADSAPVVETIPTEASPDAELLRESPSTPLPSGPVNI